VFIVITIVLFIVLKTDAQSVSSRPEEPNLSDISNVQAALKRLGLNATIEKSGLLSAVDKARLDSQPILNNGGLVFANVVDSTVTIVSLYSSSSSASYGSGFIDLIMNDGRARVITAAHVVQGATTIQVVVSNPNSSQNLQIPVDVLAMDIAGDIAVLYTRSQDFVFSPGSQKKLEWENSDLTQIGADIYILGNPSGNDFSSICQGTLRDNKYVPSFFGSVEGVFTSAPIVPGNSGGPVVNSSGRVIGLANWVNTGQGGSLLPNFSGGINSFMAMKIIGRMEEDGEMIKGYFGCSTSVVVAGLTFLQLQSQFPAFNTLNPSGILLETLDRTTPSIIPNSRFHNATPPIEDGDILISVRNFNTGEELEVGVFAGQFSPTRFSWFATPGERFEATVIRPSSNQILTNMSFFADFYPSEKDVIFSSAF
jgi:S1-C subfamily serine protease